ncbi:hypothetical protein C5167_035603 [Papaver somniferum]|uniref:Uncharacterized protein n=1 Tax=Papaver somniferum TaxID=3469 RepID=A0A4Y7KEV0_PAPSO|nr:hypothetical protein C5167_035603 [Papaver somniferum]
MSHLKNSLFPQNLLWFLLKNVLTMDFDLVDMFASYDEVVDDRGANTAIVAQC